MTPLFGRTQYLLGAVVFTLKHTFLSDGFFSLRLVVTTSVKGPDEPTHTVYVPQFTGCTRGLGYKTTNLFSLECLMRLSAT